ncbi:MAG: c-type cytochrome [Saprospiraceae bacterium]
MNHTLILWRHALLLALLPVGACDNAAEQIARKEAGASGHGSPLVADGQAIFRQKCITCHGADGQLGLNGAKNITQSQLNLDERIALVTNGKGLMTPFGGLLSATEIKAVAAYTLELK